jgi:hypothetical protein
MLRDIVRGARSERGGLSADVANRLRSAEAFPRRLDDLLERLAARESKASDKVIAKSDKLDELLSDIAEYVDSPATKTADRNIDKTVNVLNQAISETGAHADNIYAAAQDAAHQLDSLARLADEGYDVKSVEVQSVLDYLDDAGYVVSDQVRTIEGAISQARRMIRADLKNPPESLIRGWEDEIDDLVAARSGNVAEEALDEGLTAVARQEQAFEDMRRANADLIAAKTDEQKARLGEIAYKRTRIWEIEQSLGKLGDVSDDLKAALKLERDALKAEAAHDRLYYGYKTRKGGDVKGIQALQRQRDFLVADNVDKVFEDLLPQTMRTMTDAGYTSQAVSEMLAPVVHRFATEGAGGMLRYYDKVLNYLKAWRIATPGFLTRNFMGGVMNAWLDNVNPRSFGRFIADSKRVADGKAPKQSRLFGGVSADDIRAILTHLDTGQTGTEILKGANTGVAQRVNPFSAENAWVASIRAGNEQVEHALRGGVMYDWLEKNPGDIDGAVQAMYKSQFNYDDLSDFERYGVKRVIPFYTFFAKNLRFQLEIAATRPHKFVQMKRVIDNVELASDEEATPSYFEDGGFVRLPFSTGDDRLYYNSRDLPPLAAAAFVQDPVGETINSTEGLLRLPLETKFNQQAFKNLPLGQYEEEAPKAWQVVPGLMPALDQVGLAKRSKDGTWIMTGEQQYVVGTFLPILSRSQRLAPSQQRYQDRELATWASFAAGVGLRANTPQERKADRKRQQNEKRQERYYAYDPNRR